MNTVWFLKIVSYFKINNSVHIINVFPRPKILIRGYAVALWLRHYATNQKVTSSIPDEVIF
jgi:hypothetical protein